MTVEERKDADHVVSHGELRIEIARHLREDTHVASVTHEQLKKILDDIVTSRGLEVERERQRIRELEQCVHETERRHADIRHQFAAEHAKELSESEERFRLVREERSKLQAALEHVLIALDATGGGQGQLAEAGQLTEAALVDVARRIANKALGRPDRED